VLGAVAVRGRVARNSPQALIVNPYDPSNALRRWASALAMPPEEQRDRMRLMRNITREFNVYRWAGRMLLDAAAMRHRQRFHDKTETQPA
jgi:trehalose 6-phosphate synthase